MPAGPDDHVDADDEHARLAAEGAGQGTAGFGFGRVAAGAKRIAVSRLGTGAGTVAGAGAAGVLSKIIVMGFQRGVPPSSVFWRLQIRDLDQGKPLLSARGTMPSAGDFDRDMGSRPLHDNSPNTLNFEDNNLAAGLRQPTRH